MSRTRQRAVNWTVLGLGFAFLYIPVFILMVYSFNESRLATVWSGFSFKWYGELFRDKQMLQAAWISIKVAFWTATAAVVLGTMAALVMTRDRRIVDRWTKPLLMTDAALLVTAFATPVAGLTQRTSVSPSGQRSRGRPRPGRRSRRSRRGRAWGGGLRRRRARRSRRGAGRAGLPRGGASRGAAARGRAGSTRHVPRVPVGSRNPGRHRSHACRERRGLRPPRRRG